MAGFGSMPSLAAATSSRLDSSCKHIQQCRVSQDHMTMFTGDSDELIRNKYRYCVHKDEMVLGIGRPLSMSKDVKRFQNSAYPRVVSNMGKLFQRTDPDKPTESERVLKVLYHCARSLRERRELIEVLQTGDLTKTNHARHGNSFLAIATDSGGGRYLASKDVMPKLFDMIYVGFANTLGWAHAHNGDTMSSVMIGGLRTVRNGAFEVQTGDLLQWYWPFEQDCFQLDGQRKAVTLFGPAGNPKADLLVDPADADHNHDLVVGGDASARKYFRDQQYGQKRGEDKAVPLVKPYLPFDDDARLYDWYRVIGRALAPARPFEELDMQISRQAL